MQPLNYVCSWSRHRIVRRDKTPARLLKVCGPADGLSRLTLRSAAGREIGRVNVPSGAPGRWHFGFWVPESLPCAGPYILDCEKPEGLGKTRVALKPGRPGQGDEFPLRLDFTGEKLRDHLQRREQIPDARLLGGFVPDMKQYLKQHRIIFLSPADHWSEGLVLGNGAMGAIVTGERGRSQTFYLDRCDL